VHAGHRYGFDVMDATGLPDGTVYPILRRLEDKDALRGRWESDQQAHSEGRPARRYYELTAVGREAVGAALARFPILARGMGLAEGSLADEPAG
jgi:PadR family transcriptional regulator PadR